MEFERQMPFSLEAEQAVLGAILVDPAAMDRVAGIVTKDDFYLPEHGEIFSAMLRMYRQSRNIDVVLLLDELVKNGTYDEAGGTGYIKLLIEVVPTAIHAADYARVVHDKAMVRKIIAVGEAITEAAYEGSEGYEALIERAEALVWGLTETRQEKSFVHVREAIMQVYQRLQELRENPGKVLGQKTGFNALDRVLVGMSGGDLVLVGARPGMGKTAFAISIAEEVAKTSGKSVCIFSLEMSAEQLANRLLSSEAQIDSVKMRSGQLADGDWSNIAYASSMLSETEILIDDTPGITVTAMRSKLRRVKNLGMVVVDYLGLMQGESHRENRVLEIADISRGLKLLAKEFDVPVICCAQLSRAVEQRANKRPMLSDLRDSGAIEQDVDVVMFLYRDDYYGDQQKERSVAEVIVAKNRHGAQGTVKLGWLTQWTKFVNLKGDM